jgi:hypothetical protein
MESVSWVNQFGDFGWDSSRLAYVVWQAILATTITAGFILVLVIDVLDGVAAWFPIHQSNWAIILESCYLGSAFCVTLWIYTKQPDPSSWVDNERRSNDHSSIMAMVLEGIFAMLASTLTTLWLVTTTYGTPSLNKRMLTVTPTAEAMFTVIPTAEAVLSQPRTAG